MRLLIMACLLAGCGEAASAVRKPEHPAVASAWAKRQMENKPGKEWCVRLFHENWVCGGGISFATKADAIEYAKAEMAHDDYWLEASVTFSYEDDFPEDQDFRDGEWFVKPGCDQYAKRLRTAPSPPEIKPHLGVNPNPS